MRVLTLYLVLLKATILSFSGFGSLSQVREDLVVQRAVLTDEQLNRAVLAARTTPGAMGLYLVSVGHSVAGIRGAAAGWLAVITPAFLVIPLVIATASGLAHPRIRGALDGLIVASAVLVLAAAIPLLMEVGASWLNFLN